jgi:hypothetical protein
MILPSNEAMKQARWDHVASEFNYTCRTCGCRPAFKDARFYLTVGKCLGCAGSEREGGHLRVEEHRQ